MRLKDIKISRQLKIGLGTILTFVIFLGAVGWIQTDMLWKETRELYEHPLMVRRAVGELKADVLAMHRGMKDLCLAENSREQQTILQGIDVSEADAYHQFEVLHKRYLGPQSDVKEAHQAFVQWKVIRENTISMLRAGKNVEAIRRTKPSGPGGSQVDKILNEIEHISTFATDKGNQFYLTAAKHKKDQTFALGFIVAAILLLSGGVSYLLLKGIREPLKELTSATQRFQGGDFDARSLNASDNEFGILAGAFNQMAGAVQTEMEARQKAALIAHVMLREEDLRPFCRELLEVLMEHTGSQVGGVYLLNEEKTAFEHYESIGLGSGRRASFSASDSEGEFGTAFVSGQIQYITNIPADTPFTFSAMSGNLKPREIITIPILSDNKVIAIISLAGLRDYSESSIRLVKDIWSVLTARMNGVLAFRKIREFSEKLEHQNRELEAQKRELSMQANELAEQNTELEMQKYQLEEASQMKSQFLSNMSHELRTPLNSVLALSRVLMMQGKEKLSAEEVKYLEIIERNGKNLLALINDILDLSKIEAGRMDINPQHFSLTMTLENIIESIMPLAEEKHIDIRKDIPRDLPYIESDEIRVSQIIQNLISNAVKFTSAGSVIVCAAYREESISVRIIDTGIGIAAGDLHYIFDEFRQVDGSSSRKYEGTGLGLAIARKAARMLGGNITAASVPGEGSTFTITLPVTWQGKAPPWKPFATGPLPDAKTTYKTILIVDDDPETAATISRYLLREGYNTITASSGAEALKLAARELPFAITLDVIMPDMDGWEVLQSLKKNPDTRNIPVIIVSISEEQETGFALGAVGYVSKPVSRKRLISEIQKINTRETRSVMIVDDNELDRQEIARIVEEEGMTAIAAEGGAACLELIAEKIPDVLVLDLMMPEPDGFIVLEKIRNNPATRDLPVIVVTAKDLTEEDRQKLSGNVFSVLEKSTSTPIVLLKEIKRILENLEGRTAEYRRGNAESLPRILLVEDTEAAIIQIKTVLEGAGYCVDVARGGQEAIDYVSHTIPDGIVLDLMMPEIDGFEVLEKIRGTKATLKIPVLILTAKDLTPEDFRKLSANHVQQLVQKGCVDKEHLLLKVSSMLKADPEPPVRHDIGRDTGPTRDALMTLSILIMEDNPDSMATIEAVLQNRYRIMEAKDGEEGLRIAAQTRPDLILLDMALPKMDGYAVVRHLKCDRELNPIPVIALTSRAMKGDREKILEAGCDDYIAKPIDPESFLKKIDEWLIRIREGI
jgi:CheY-like chemotaxis protein